MVSLTINNHHLKPFNIEAKNSMEHYLSMIETELNDYTFAQNFIWQSYASGFYSIVNDTFCMFLLSGEELTMLLPPIGSKEKVNDALIECFDIMNYHNSSIYYSRIDYVYEQFLEGFVNYLEEETEIFEIIESYIVEKKLVDYIYLTEDLIDLEGNNYHTKRNEINKFKKSYPDIVIEALDPKIHTDLVLELLNNWIANRLKYMPKDRTELFLDGISHERFAIKRALKYFEKLDLIGIVLRINGKVAGFTIGEKLNNHTASILIEKTDFEILESAQYIFREFCKILQKEYHCKYINVGDDMGFENLKKVKISYRPYKLLQNIQFIKNDNCNQKRFNRSNAT